MRQIEITDGVSYNQTIGVIGEHRATELQITLPDDMTTDVDYWIAVFKSGTRTVESGVITDVLSADGNAIVTDGILYIKLWQELTAAPCLTLTVSAYKMDGDEAVLIASMPLIGDFYFSAANIEGEPADTDAGGMAVDVASLKTHMTAAEDDISDLQEDSHTHTNKSLLDTYTQTETALADAVSKKHEHPNKELLDLYDGTSSSGGDGHTHPNKSILDNTTAEYTTAKDSKLSGIATGAQVNVLESVKYNGAAVAVTDKAVDIAPNKFATPALVRLTPYGSEITLESNKEYNISLADDAEIVLPPAPGTTYSGTILLCLTCMADINLTFDASVKLDSGVSTDTGYHELLITFHPGEGKWWVRQTPEVT